MNFLLVFPKYASKGQKYDFYFGLALLSSVMKQHGLNVFCLNPNHSDAPLMAQLNDAITEHRIDAVVTGGMSIHYAEISEVLRCAKEINSSITTIAGGVIVTSNPALAMKHLESMDYGIVGEGEVAIIELADALINKSGISEIPGLVYKGHVNKPRTTPTDINSLPIMDYEGFRYGEYISMYYPSDSHFHSIMDFPKSATVMISRSCPYSCTFCYHPLGKKYRQRNLDHVFAEINYLVMKYGINHIAFVDDLFSVDKKYMLEFAQRIKPYNIKWWTSFRVGDVDADILSTLKDSGLFLIGYGIESVSPTILTSMKKHITREQIENALQITIDAGISYQGNILVGDVVESESTINESIAWLQAHPQYKLNLVMLRTYPGTDIYQHALKSGIITDEFEYIKRRFPLINLTSMSDMQYNSVSAYVENYDYQNYGKVVVSSQKDGINSILIQCPDCKQYTIYRNMRQAGHDVYFKVVCRRCGYTMQIESLQAYPQNYTAIGKSMSKLIKFLRAQVNKSPLAKAGYIALKIINMKVAHAIGR